MWITNGGFADVIIVFAKVDGEHFTAFIVERAFPGVSAGKEEHKMGLHGSSTTPIILQDAKVPAGNVLGEVGKGHKVALNTLNFGRFKLGGMCVGGSRVAIGDAARYAGARRQFGHPIATFGAIRYKLGEMTARTYAMESLIYRTAGLIDAALAATSRDGASVAQAFEEYAVEASIAKVGGTEVLDYVLDENIQIHGGNGFVKDYPAERYYRDARVNRIFEGTNEVNRLLIPGMVIRRALKGDLALIAAAKALQDELLAPSAPASFADDTLLGRESLAVSAFKKVVLIVLGTAMQTYGQKLNDEQEILGYAADIMIDTCAAESAVLRARAAATAALPRADLHAAAAQTFVSEAAQRVEHAARSALAAMAEGDSLRTLLAALRRVLKIAPVNTVALRRRLADASVEQGRYILE
jgi:alkylation response protein AidB-like acyl-CoA dehydrogenase